MAILFYSPSFFERKSPKKLMSSRGLEHWPFLISQLPTRLRLLLILLELPITILNVFLKCLSRLFALYASHLLTFSLPSFLPLLLASSCVGDYRCFMIIELQYLKHKFFLSLCVPVSFLLLLKIFFKFFLLWLILLLLLYLVLFFYYND